PVRLSMLGIRIVCKERHLADDGPTVPSRVDQLDHQSWYAILSAARRQAIKLTNFGDKPSTRREQCIGQATRKAERTLKTRDQHESGKTACQPAPMQTRVSPNMAPA